MDRYGRESRALCCCGKAFPLRHGDGDVATRSLEIWHSQSAKGVAGCMEGLCRRQEAGKGFQSTG